MTDETVNPFATPGPSSTEAGYEDAQHGDGHHDDSHYAILFLFVSCLVGAVSRHLLAKVPVPYTALLLVWGVAFGLLEAYEGSLGKPFHLAVVIWLKMTPHLLLYTFMPILLFASGFSLDWHIFKVCFNQCLMLAGPGVMISTALTAVFVKFCFPYGWDWPKSLLCGAILSATDPVAVVALLKEVGASKKLGIVIEGESLLNDGTAFVLFLVFQEMAEGVRLGPAEITVQFIQLALGGPAVGILFAALSTWWLSWIFNDACLEISITLTLAYLCFFTAEGLFGVSSVLAIVSCGVYMAAIGKTRITPSVEHPMEIFWEMLEYLGNTVIFVYSGLLVGISLARNDSANPEDAVRGADWGWCILLYVMLQVIRGATVMLLYPILKRLGYGINWRTAIVMVWAGLRGAMGLALALIISLNNNIHDQQFRTLIRFFVSMVAMLTIVLNGATMPYVLKKLGILSAPKAKQDFLEHSLQEMNDCVDKRCAHLRHDRLMGDPDWAMVKQLTYIETSHIEEDSYQRQKARVNFPGSRFTPSQGSQVHPAVSEVAASVSKEALEHLEDARMRFLSIVKMTYAEGFEKGYISGYLLSQLKECADKCLDHCATEIRDWRFLEPFLEVPAWVRVLNNKLQFLNNVADDKKQKKNPILLYITRMPQNLLYAKLRDCAVLGMSFVFAHSEARHKMRLLMSAEDEGTAAEAKEAYNIVIRESAQEAVAAHKYIDQLRKTYPEVMRMIKTQLTAHTVLMHKKRFVNGIVHSGLVDDREGTEMLNLVNLRVKELLFNPPIPDVQPPEELLRKCSLFHLLHQSDYEEDVLSSARHVVIPAYSKVNLRQGGTMFMAKAEVQKRLTLLQMVHSRNSIDAQQEELLENSSRSVRGSMDEKITHVFCITRGFVKMKVSGDCTVQTGLGDVVGMLTFLTGRDLLEPACTQTTAEGFYISVRHMEDLLYRYPQLEVAAWKSIGQLLLDISDGDTTLFETSKPEGMLSIFQDAKLVTMAANDELCLPPGKLALLAKGKLAAVDVGRQISWPCPLHYQSNGHTLRAETDCKLLVMHVDHLRVPIQPPELQHVDRTSSVDSFKPMNKLKKAAKEVLGQIVEADSHAVEALLDKVAEKRKSPRKQDKHRALHLAFDAMESLGKKHTNKAARDVLGIGNQSTNGAPSMPFLKPPSPSDTEAGLPNLVPSQWAHGNEDGNTVQVIYA